MPPSISSSSSTASMATATTPKSSSLSSSSLSISHAMPAALPINSLNIKPNKPAAGAATEADVLPPPIIHFTDVSPAVLAAAIAAVTTAYAAKDNQTSITHYQRLAKDIKDEMDNTQGATWHCVVGTAFGSFVTHQTNGGIIMITIQELNILLFKHG